MESHRFVDSLPARIQDSTEERLKRGQRITSSKALHLYQTAKINKLFNVAVAFTTVIYKIDRETLFNHVSHDHRRHHSIYIIAPALNNFFVSF